MNEKTSSENVKKPWLRSAFEYVGLLGIGGILGGGLIYMLDDVASKDAQIREAIKAEVQRREKLEHVPADTIITTTVTEDYAGVLLPRTITTKKTFAQAANCHHPQDFGQRHLVLIGGENGKGWKEVAVLCP